MSRASPVEAADINTLTAVTTRPSPRVRGAASTPPELSFADGASRARGDDPATKTWRGGASACSPRTRGCPFIRGDHLQEAGPLVPRVPPDPPLLRRRRRIALHIRHARERARLTQQAVAERTGMDRSSYQDIEYGKVSPMLDSLRRDRGPAHRAGGGGVRPVRAGTGRGAAPVSCSPSGCRAARAGAGAQGPGGV
ncbi:helix-turn-helix domain-containing protein [Streptomyces zhihengii]